MVTDRKLPVADQTDPTKVAYFTADVVSYSDYLPFGQIMPNKHGDDNQYRYGFNGKEKIDEMEGDGNSYDFGARMYDPRIGRWLSLDPLMDQFPWMSPFVGFDNNPILYIDPYGLNTIEKDTPVEGGEGETKGSDGPLCDGQDGWGAGEGAKAPTPPEKKPIGRFSSIQGMPTDSKGDSKYGDKPSELNKYTEFRLALGETLNKNNFERCLYMSTMFVDYNAGERLSNQFIYGAGKNLYWSEKSSLASEISSSQAFIDYAQSFEKNAIDHFMKNGSLDGFETKATELLGKELNLNFESVFLTATVGGVQKVTATITKITSNDIEVTYTLYDRFGAGFEDQQGGKSTLPGLVPFYVLQHYYGTENKYRPFVNVINVKR